MRKTFNRFRAAPVFTGFILCMSILIVNVIVQGPANFFSAKNFGILFSKNTPFVLAALAQSLLLITGTLDISIGMQMALVNVIAIMGHEAAGLPIAASWTLGVAAAVTASLLNSLCTVRLGLPVLLSGLAVTMVIKGLNVFIMRVPQGSVPSYIYKTYDSLLFGYIPFSFFIVALVLCFWLFLKNTRYGKHIYAVGGDPRNAFAAGIDPVRTQMKAFAISGVIIGLAGLSLTAMTASGNPLQTEIYGLRALSACIIGGLGFGGWGSMSCGFFGAAFIVLIQNTVYHFFTLLYKWIPGFTVSSYWQNLLSDVIVFVGLLMTIVTSKAQRETLRQGLARHVKGGERIGK